MLTTRAGRREGHVCGSKHLERKFCNPFSNQRSFVSVRTMVRGHAWYDRQALFEVSRPGFLLKRRQSLCVIRGAWTESPRDDDAVDTMNGRWRVYETAPKQFTARVEDEEEVALIIVNLRTFVSKFTMDRFVEDSQFIRGVLFILLLPL